MTLGGLEKKIVGSKKKKYISRPAKSSQPLSPIHPPFPPPPLSFLTGVEIHKVLQFHFFFSTFLPLPNPPFFGGGKGGSIEEKSTVKSKTLNKLLKSNVDCVLKQVFNLKFLQAARQTCFMECELLVPR